MSMSSLFGGAMPVGTILDYPAGATPPVGWMTCDGSVLAQASYPVLFGILGHIPQPSAATLFAATSSLAAASGCGESNGRLLVRRSVNTGLPDEWAYSTDGGATFTAFGNTGAAAGTAGQSNVSWNGTRWVFVRSETGSSATVRWYHSTDGNNWTSGGAYSFGTNGTPNIVSMAGLGHVVTHSASSDVIGTASDTPGAMASRGTSGVTTTSVMGRGYACAISGVGFLLTDGGGVYRFCANGGGALQTPTGTPSAGLVFAAGGTFFAVAPNGAVATSTNGTAFTDRSSAARAAGLVKNAVAFASNGTYAFVGDGNSLVRAPLSDVSSWENVFSVAAAYTSAGGAAGRRGALKLGLGSASDGRYTAALNGPSIPDTLALAASPTTGRVVLSTSASGDPALWMSVDGGATWGRAHFRDCGIDDVANTVVPGTYSNDAFLLFSSASNSGRRFVFPYTQGTQFQIPRLLSPMHGVTKIIKVF